MAASADCRTRTSVQTVSVTVHIKDRWRGKAKLSLYTLWHMRSRGTAPLILNLSTRWRGVVTLNPWPLYPWRRSHQYPLNRRLSGPHSQSECCEEKNVTPLMGFKPQIVQGAVQWLHQLHYPGSWDECVHEEIIIRKGKHILGVTLKRVFTLHMAEQAGSFAILIVHN
jgi:hypothetical protein